VIGGWVRHEFLYKRSLRGCAGNPRQRGEPRSQGKRAGTRRIRIDLRNTETARSEGVGTLGGRRRGGRLAKKEEKEEYRDRTHSEIFPGPHLRVTSAVLWTERGKELKDWKDHREVRIRLMSAPNTTGGTPRKEKKKNKDCTRGCWKR